VKRFKSCSLGTLFFFWEEERSVHHWGERGCRSQIKWKIGKGGGGGGGGVEKRVLTAVSQRH